MPTLIVGRILQGLGGGGFDVLGEVILADITTLKERPLYLGLFSVPLAEVASVASSSGQLSASM